MYDMNEIKEKNLIKIEDIMLLRRFLSSRFPTIDNKFKIYSFEKKSYPFKVGLLAEIELEDNEQALKNRNQSFVSNCILVKKQSIQIEMEYKEFVTDYHFNNDPNNPNFIAVQNIPHFRIITNHYEYGAYIPEGMLEQNSEMIYKIENPDKDKDKMD